MSYPKIANITPDEFQEFIIEFSKNYKIYGTDRALPTYTHGMSGECGEVMELFKRYYRGDYDDQPIEEFKIELTKELGDMMAYLTLICSFFGISLEDVMIENIRKLQKREAKGNLIGKGSNR